MVMCMTSFAQVTLEHTFDGPCTSSFQFVNTTIDCFITHSDNQICLYSSNYSLYKTINVSLPSGYKVSTVSPLGKAIVNTDNKIELFISAVSLTNSGTNNFYDAIIINEDGAIIHDFGYANIYGMPSVIKIGNKPKLVVYHSSINTSQYIYDIYSCSGNYTGNSVKLYESDNQLAPYPNPTTNIINLPYKLEKGTTTVMNIYTINGQFVESYNLGSDFEMITLDVNNYPKGVYVYEYNGKSNRFIVQ